MKQILMDGFDGYFRYFLRRRRSSDDFSKINRWKKIFKIFKSKLVRMIKNPGGKFDDYSI